MSLTATRGGPANVAPSDGSRTITIRDSQPREEGGEGGSHEPSSNNSGRLILRGGRNKNSPRVVWAEDTIDNEGMGKKSSKICCIYHKPRKFDESSSEESSESDSDSSCGGHNHSHAARRRHHHPANGDQGDQNNRHREGGESAIHELSSDDEAVNRYERAPRKPKKGKGVAQN